MITRVRHYLGHVVLVLAQVFFVLMFLKLFVVDIGIVDGTSMEPGFSDGQIYLVDHVSYFFRAPARGDVVQLFHPERPDQVLIKRVIGVPGDTLVLKHQNVYERLDDKEVELDEPYVAVQNRTMIPFGADPDQIITDQMYFVLGDNRAFSNDSRAFGAVSRSYILGRVVRLK